MTVTVRKALASDTSAMARIMSTVAEEGSIGTEPPVDIDALRDRFRRTIDSDSPAAMWVLEEDRRVVGHASALETHANGVLSLAMVILSEGRVRGGGRALLDAVLEHARTCGAHKLDLEVWPDNARAIALYTGTGFEVEGLRRDHYRRRDGSLRSTLIMAKRC